MGTISVKQADKGAIALDPANQFKALVVKIKALDVELRRSDLTPKQVVAKMELRDRAVKQAAYLADILVARMNKPAYFWSAQRKSFY